MDLGGLVLVMEISRWLKEAGTKDTSSSAQIFLFFVLFWFCGSSENPTFLDFSCLLAADTLASQLFGASAHLALLLPACKHQL